MSKPDQEQPSGCPVAHDNTIANPHGKWNIENKQEYEATTNTGLKNHPLPSTIPRGGQENETWVYLT